MCRLFSVLLQEIAELIQAESRQPYLLTPAQESGLKDVFFCPVNDRTPGVKLRPEDISRFVRLLNPGKVIVLGDTRYVPESYLPELDGRIPVVRINCDDWARTAEMLGSMLNLNYLEKDYREIGKKLDKNALYKPLPAAAKVEEPKKEETPAVPAAPVEEPKPAAKLESQAAAPDPAAGQVTPVGEIKNER